MLTLDVSYSPLCQTAPIMRMLPRDTMAVIFSFLSRRTLNEAMLVCVEWGRVVSSRRALIEETLKRRQRRVYEEEEDYYFGNDDNDWWYGGYEYDDDDDDSDNDYGAYVNNYDSDD